MQPLQKCRKSSIQTWLVPCHRIPIRHYLPRSCCGCVRRGARAQPAASLHAPVAATALQLTVAASAAAATRRLRMFLLVSATAPRTHAAPGA
jgi:hypothetical protein